MADTNSGSALDSLLSIGQRFATPFVRSFAYGKDRASEMELQDERNDYNALNGSGATDPFGASNRPKSDAQRNFDQPANGGMLSSFGLTGGTQNILILLAVGVLVAIVVKKFLK